MSYKQIPKQTGTTLYRAPPAASAMAMVEVMMPKSCPGPRHDAIDKPAPLRRHDRADDTQEAEEANLEGVVAAA